MIAAVTGGGGFIGRRLVERLVSEGSQVRVLTRQPVAGSDDGRITRVAGDLVDPNIELDGFVDGADVLFHCAGEVRDPRRMRVLHVDGTLRLLETATGRVGRWVQLSSVGVYGPRRSGTVTEAAEWRPVGEYEKTKAESDRLVQEALRAHHLAATVLRPSIVFGEGMTNQSLYQLIALIERGWFRFVGPTGASANYVHVDNVVEALVRCGSDPRAPGSDYVLSDWRTMEELVGAIARALGRPVPTGRLPEGPLRLVAGVAGRLPKVPLSVSRIDALTSRARYSTERIERELGYSHPVAMEEGLTRLVQDWKGRR